VPGPRVLKPELSVLASMLLGAFALFTAAKMTLVIAAGEKGVTGTGIDLWLAVLGSLLLGVACTLSLYRNVTAPASQTSPKPRDTEHSKPNPPTASRTNTRGALIGATLAILGFAGALLEVDEAFTMKPDFHVTALNPWLGFVTFDLITAAGLFILRANRK